MGTQADDAGVECTVGPQNGLDGECRRDVGGLCELGSPPVRQHPDGGHCLGAVDEGEALFCLEHEWREPEEFKSGHGGHLSTIDSHLPLADDRECQMGERGKVPGRAE